VPRLICRSLIHLISVASGFLILALPAFADDEVKRLSEPVVSTATHEVFGALLPEQGTPIGLAELINNGEKYQDQEVLVATRIAKVCQKKGCFFVATEGAATARISFKDYGFFIPTDAGGKEVLLLGTFSHTGVSEKEAEHFASDLGDTANPDPEQFPYSIVASAVQIPKS
jgi:hypothetical protein